MQLSTEKPLISVNFGGELAKGKVEQWKDYVFTSRPRSNILQICLKIINLNTTTSDHLRKEEKRKLCR